MITTAVTDRSEQKYVSVLCTQGVPVDLTSKVQDKAVQLLLLLLPACVLLREFAHGFQALCVRLCIIKRSSVKQAHGKTN